MAKRLTEAQLIEKINLLHKEDQHQAIIELIENECGDDRPVAVTSLLARAYNNLEYGSEYIAHALLMSIEEQCKDQSLWHFRVGYSLFYMDKYDQALAAFEHCKKLNKDEENVDYFIEQCQKMIGMPLQITPFQERVKSFWQDFSEQQAELFELGKIDTAQLMNALSELFWPYFDFIDFEVGVHDDRAHLVLSPNGMLDALIAIKYLVKKAPQFDKWYFTIGRSAMPMGIEMFGVNLSPEDTYCRIEKEQNDSFRLFLYNDALAELHQQDQNKALHMAYIYTDTFFGELFMMQHCNGVDIETIKSDLAEPLEVAFEQLNNDYKTSPNYPEENYMAYQMQFEAFNALREDVVIGNAINGSLINQYYQAEDDIVSKNLGNGIVYFFLYYDNRKIDKKEIVNFRAEIEDRIAAHYGEDVVLIGGATGNHYSYIDLISYDFRSFMRQIEKLLEDFEIKDLSVSVFRKNATAYAITTSEKNNEDFAPIVYEEKQLNAVEAHIEKYFGKIESVFHELVSPDIHVDIHVIEPSEERNYYTLVTTGMGAFLMNVPQHYSHLNISRAEVMIHLPANWDIKDDAEVNYWPLRWLKIMARLPIEQNTWLGYGHSVPNGGSFSEMDRFTALMLLTPALAEGGADVCKLDNGEEVNFYNLIPLYEEEINYKLEHGSEALIEMFKKKGIGPYEVFVVNINRASAVATEQKPLN